MEAEEVAEPLSCSVPAARFCSSPVVVEETAVSMEETVLDPQPPEETAAMVAVTPMGPLAGALAAAA